MTSLFRLGYFLSWLCMICRQTETKVFRSVLMQIHFRNIFNSDVWNERVVVLSRLLSYLDITRAQADGSDYIVLLRNGRGQMASSGQRTEFIDPRKSSWLFSDSEAFIQDCGLLVGNWNWVPSLALLFSSFTLDKFLIFIVPQFPYLCIKYVKVNGLERSLLPGIRVKYEAEHCFGWNPQIIR